jgi:hypothetical protein
LQELLYLGPGGFWRALQDQVRGFDLPHLDIRTNRPERLAGRRLYDRVVARGKVKYWDRASPQFCGTVDPQHFAHAPRQYLGRHLLDGRFHAPDE